MASEYNERDHDEVTKEYYKREYSAISKDILGNIEELKHNLSVFWELNANPVVNEYFLSDIGNLTTTLEDFEAIISSNDPGKDPGNPDFKFAKVGD